MNLKSRNFEEKNAFKEIKCNFGLITRIPSRNVLPVYLGGGFCSKISALCVETQKFWRAFILGTQKIQSMGGTLLSVVLTHTHRCILRWFISTLWPGKYEKFIFIEYEFKWKFRSFKKFTKFICSWYCRK